MERSIENEHFAVRVIKLGIIRSKVVWLFTNEVVFKIDKVAREINVI
jgi:hypothetical protein